MGETAEQKAERERLEAEAAAGGAVPPPVATKEKPKEKSPLVLVGIQVSYLCPNPDCGETVNAGEDKETDELELTPETEFRAELPALEGFCDFCKQPLRRKKIVISYL